MASLAPFLGAAALALLLLRARSAAQALALPNTPVWEEAPPCDDPAWQPLPPLPPSARLQCDVCVIGLGGSGLTAVLALLRGGGSPGLRVVGLDAACAGSGAAGRNGGLLLAGSAQFYHDAVALQGRARARALYLDTVAELEALFAELAPLGLARRTGSLRIAADAAEARDCAAQLAAMAADGLPVEPYAGPEGTGLRFPTDGVMQPLRRVRHLARAALAAGAALHGCAAVRALHPRAPAAGGGTEVEVEGGARLTARRVIVAVDGRLELLLPELAPRVRTARLQMVATAPCALRAAAAAAAPAPPLPVYTRWGYDYWQQLPSGRIAVGGFRDCEEAAEWTHSSAPTAAIQARLAGLLRERLRCQAPITHAWAASVAYTHAAAPDWGAPVCEEVRPGVFAIGAYSGTGNVLGALCGKAAAAWALRSLEQGS
jgi:gamma-glutamylputrescine oxidase